MTHSAFDIAAPAQPVRVGRRGVRPLAAAGLALAVGGAGGLAFALGASRLSPMFAAAGVGAIALGLYLLKTPVAGLYLLAATVPIERFGRLTDDTAAFTVSIPRGIGVLAIGALAAHILVRKRPVYISMPLVLWTAFVAICLMSLTHTSDWLGSVRIAGGYVGNIVFLFYVTNAALAGGLAATRHRANIAIFIWLAVSTAMALYSIYDWHLGSGQTGGIPVGEVDPQAGAQVTEHRWSTVWQDTAEVENLSGLSLRRSMGPTSHAAVFGVNLVMTIPFFLYGLRRRFGAVAKAGLLIGLAATLYCVLLTNTRSVLMLAVGTLGLCLLWGLIPLKTWHLLGALAAGVVAPLFIPVDIFNRVLDVQNYLTTNSDAMQIRFDYWTAGLQAIREHWLTGLGVGNQLAVLEYLRNPIEGRSHMHNIYLQTAMDVGIFGWMVFIAFLATAQITVHRAGAAMRRLGRIDDYRMFAAAHILMISVLVYGLQVDVFYFPLKGWWLVVGLTLAVAWALHRERRAAEGPTPALATKGKESFRS